MPSKSITNLVPITHLEIKVEVEMNAYQILEPLVSVSELLSVDEEREVFLKEYIDGETVASLIAEDKLPGYAIATLFEMSKRIFDASLNLDWFPNNFVVSDKKLIYVDYEYNAYSDEWNLENWGIWYWANSEGMKHYLETGSHEKINKNVESGKPIQSPFEPQVRDCVRGFVYDGYNLRITKKPSF